MQDNAVSAVFRLSMPRPGHRQSADRSETNENEPLFESMFYPERIILNIVFFCFFLGQDFLINKMTRSKRRKEIYLDHK